MGYDDMSYESIFAEKEDGISESDQMCKRKQISNHMMKGVNNFKNISARYLNLFMIIVFSFLIHAVIFQSLYACINQLEASKHSGKPISIKIHKQSFFIEPPDTTFKPKKKQSKKLLNKLKKAFKKKLSTHQLISIGKQKAKQDGHFPALILTYKNPRKYIKGLYYLGAITILLNKKNNKLMKVDLFQNKLFELDSKTLNHYSDLKRVIRDDCWKMNRIQYARQLSVSTDDLELIMLIPDQVEYLWMGHQINLFQKHGLKISEIASVEGEFYNKKLKLIGVVLFSGKQKRIVDMTGI